MRHPTLLFWLTASLTSSIKNEGISATLHFLQPLLERG